MIAARGRLGDAVRRNEQRIRAERSLAPLASAIGVSREFFYRVLAGGEVDHRPLEQRPDALSRFVIVRGALNKRM
jgi:hypothetical protein